MPRPARLHFPGAVFHAMSRGNGGQTLFHDPSDYRAFLDLLGAVKKRNPFKLYAYCLMPNHFHLLVEVDRFPLSLLMQHLLTRYSLHFNHRRERKGHVFQSRFKAILCNRDAYLLELLRYIHLNPVRAKLAERPGDWPWSGHSGYSGVGQGGLIDFEFPLSIFHQDLAPAKVLMERFVLQGLDREGDERLAEFQAGPVPVKVDLAAHQAEGRKSMEELGEEFAWAGQIPLAVLRGASRVRSIMPARHGFIRASLDRGFTPTEIAAFLNCSPSAICKALVRAGEQFQKVKYVKV